MDNKAFTYWLAGLFELAEGTASDPLKVGLSPAQVRVLKDHLDLTLAKVTPDRAAKPAAPSKEPTYCAGNVPASPFRGNLLCGTQIERLDLLSDAPIC